MSGSAAGLTWELIEAARARIASKVSRTPVMTSATLDALSGAQLYFKCENFQKGGAFKARGATNAVFALSAEQAQRGVATHSSGNHGAALARAARLRGIRAYVVMPENTAAAKRAAVSRLGAQITWCTPTQRARDDALEQLLATTGATLIHPYDDWVVMAGQATMAVELLSQVPELDVIFCPIGGGGLISGTAAAAKKLKPDIRIVGVEPAGADDAARSVRAGTIEPCEHPDTIADGLRATIGEKTFAQIRRSVDEIITVADDTIARAMRQLWEVLKIVVEPSGAVAYAALLDPGNVRPGARIGIIVSGGNLDLDRLPWQ